MNVMSSKTIIDVYEFEPYPLGRHPEAPFKFDGCGFSTSKGHRGGSLGVLHKRKNLEFGGSVFGDNRGTRGAGIGFKCREKVTLPNFDFHVPKGL
jgi:hypothetical protein